MSLVLEAGGDSAEAWAPQKFPKCAPAFFSSSPQQGICLPWPDSEQHHVGFLLPAWQRDRWDCPRAKQGEAGAESRAFLPSRFFQLTGSGFSSRAATPSPPQTHGLQFRTGFVLPGSSLEFVFLLFLLLWWLSFLISQIHASCGFSMVDSGKQGQQPRLFCHIDVTECFLKDYFVS